MDLRPLVEKVGFKKPKKNYKNVLFCTQCKTKPWVNNYSQSHQLQYSVFNTVKFYLSLLRTLKNYFLGVTGLSKNRNGSLFKVEDAKY